MDCKLVEVKQNSEEWEELRRGRVTASCMRNVMAKKTTKAYQDYRQQIAMELLGFEDHQADAHWAEHGRQGEPFARGAYCWKLGCEVTPDVFCIHKDYDWLAASPDGLVLPDYERAIEIKCRRELRTWLKKVGDQERLGRIDPTYKAQVQAQIWIMGLPSIDYVEFWQDPEGVSSKMRVKTVARDEEYIAKMEERAIEFMIECYKLADQDHTRIAA